MDLLEMSDFDLYFDEPLPENIEQLIRQAADAYARPESEYMLLFAYMLLPHHPSVHVALYRYYYYKHRLRDALLIADRTLEDAGIRLGFFGHWSEANLQRLKASDANMTMVRYYLLALKGSGFICLRLGRKEEGFKRLKQVIAMDREDRLGAAAILEVIESAEVAEV